MTKIDFFKTSRGDEPAKEYMSNIKRKDEIPHIIRILKMIKKTDSYTVKTETKNIERLNNIIDQIKYHKHRIPFCKGIGRIYLLSGFYKKTRKTPKRELDLAINRYKILLKEGKIQ